MSRRASGKLWILALLLLISGYLSLRFGSSHMRTADFWQGLLRAPGMETYSLILYTIRLPRLLAALLAGAGLSISGVLLQSVTGNELASPNIIGVNAGAGFCVILFLCFFPQAIYALPFAAFFGAFLTTLLIMSVANRIGSGKSTIILAGIAFTAVLNAGISFVSLLDTDVLTSYNYFSIGGVAGVRKESLLIPGVIIAMAFAAAMAISRKIDLLCLGDSMAMSLGVPVKAVRMACLVCASASAAAAVSFAGLLGFVGLVVPHIARKLVGMETKSLLAASVLTGGIVVVLADLAGRVLFAPSELPVGIMMSVIGAPFFFALLLRRKGGR
ncbi:MAG TPA: iron ABC transporter permease [Candidatus Faecousia intestinigallinarum]|nr:iron ABC transporter permease [Candidatus Faecousia intestinigallinarum]